MMLNIYIEVTGDNTQVKYQLPVEDLDLSADQAEVVRAAIERFAGKIMDVVQS